MTTAHNRRHLAATPVQILEIRRLRNSTNGNPRFELIVDDQLSWAAVLTTQSDNSLNYEITNPGFRAGDWVYLTLTRAGRIEGIKTAQSGLAQ